MGTTIVRQQSLSKRGQPTSWRPTHHSQLWIFGALLMMWPALYNRYPIIYPDTMTYLGDGRVVARALFLHRFSSYYGERSFFYSLGILPFHWNVTPWPVVAFQCLLTSFVLWMVWRSVLPRSSGLGFLGFCAVLSFSTSLSWYTSLIMPDIFGPVLYLCMYLLLFARESLSRGEHWAVAMIAWWAVTCHGTHLMLAVTLFLLLLLLPMLGLGALRLPWRVKAPMLAILILAAGAQLAMHKYLYGEASLFGEHPPFLMARVIADGPGRWYLERKCDQPVSSLCGQVRALPPNADDFLWQDNGIWQGADDRKQRLLRKEEIPFVMAVVSTYPREQLLMSVGNFFEQLIHFGLRNFGPNEWTLSVFESVFPGGTISYLHGREASDDLPYDMFTVLQECTVAVAVLVIASLSPGIWLRGDKRFCGLQVVIVTMVIGNAWFTATMSMVEDRFQGRVVWLLPLLAGLLLLDRAGQSQDSSSKILHQTGVRLFQPSNHAKYARW